MQLLVAKVRSEFGQVLSLSGFAGSRKRVGGLADSDQHVFGYTSPKDTFSYCFRLGNE